jgi:uncharacterized membrane protein HdeD (DUF308 family)
MDLILILIGIFLLIDGVLSLKLQIGSKEENLYYDLERILRTFAGAITTIIGLYFPELITNSIIESILIIIAVYIVLSGALSIATQYKSKEEHPVYQLGRSVRMLVGIGLALYIIIL